MISHIKDNVKHISRTNIIIWFCLWVFSFTVLQNSATADEVIRKPSYLNSNITDFIIQTTSDIFSNSVKTAKEYYNWNFNILEDTSLQKYVSDKVLLENKNYVPSDLVEIRSDYIVNISKRPYLRQPAKIAFEKMAEDFYHKFSKKFYLVSAYRTYKDQAILFEFWCSSVRCAKIWWSEHQLWLAVDIHIATTNWYKKFNWEYMDRMNNNAHKYGFINTYSKWVEVDGKMKEVWHWRYVWVPLATKLYKHNLSFAEYYKEHFTW